VVERGARRISEAKPAHDDVEIVSVEQTQSEVCESDFDVVEEAGHQEIVAKFHLEHFEVVEFPDAPASQGEIPKGRLTVVQFCKSGAHFNREGKAIADGKRNP